MLFNWSGLIKKFIALDTIWGGRSKKLAGINDSNNYTTGNFVFTAGTNIIQFPGTLPEWVVADKYFRITFGGGLNNTALYRILGIDFDNNTIITHENIQSFTGGATLDGRLWVVINDATIARSTNSGATMYNVHNRTTTGKDDSSGIGLVFAEHFHDEPEPAADEGEILTHIYNEIGTKHMSLDSCNHDVKIEIGPLIVVDRQGNVVKAMTHNPYDTCYIPEEEYCQ